MASIHACFGFALVLSAFGAGFPAQGGGEEEKVAMETATMFRAARKVISDQQALINDASKGDKGLSGEKVVATMKENYSKATGTEWKDAEAGSLTLDVQKAMCAAIEKVMGDAQTLINEKDKGFKGFLPAVFAKQVAEHVSQSMAGRVFIKLTAPKAYVRNRANRPDAWESDVIETKFKSATWAKGKAWSELGKHKDKDGLRLMIPEYYGQSCLACHGDKKGERDITGGLKEGGKLDEVGGAISVVVYTANPAPAK